MTKIKQTKSHSPLPWSLDPRGIGTRWNICSADEKDVALPHEVSDDPEHETRDANTALILRRVNAGPAADALAEVVDRAAGVGAIIGFLEDPLGRNARNALRGVAEELLSALNAYREAREAKP